MVLRRRAAARLVPSIGGSLPRIPNAGPIWALWENKDHANWAAVSFQDDLAAY